MNKTEQGDPFLKGFMPNILTILTITGILFIGMPFIEKTKQEVGADPINYHSESSTDYPKKELLTFHENTLSPFHVFPAKEKSFSVITIKQEDYVVIDVINTTITAYSSTVDQTDSDPFITASGAWVEDGIVAANFLPFGTKIRIPKLFGDKIFVVKDRMNARYNNRVDIWFSSRQQAINFGLQNTKIEIIKEI